MRRIDLTGQKFGMLTVIEKSATRYTHWMCRCDCGSVREVLTQNLRRGNTKTCGCTRGVNRRTHGQSNGGGRTEASRTYQIWQHIKARCERKNAPDFYLYGERGIKVCERWQSFENFNADMGDAPAGMSIDRIDNEGDYTPQNCRWATPQMQANNRRSNRFINYEGEQFTVAQLARVKGLKYTTLSMRLKWGWPLDRALSPTK